VRGLFARENGQGMFFPVEETAPATADNPTQDTVVETAEKKPSGTKKPFLKLVK
jgi:stringent starvation protein B